MTNKKIIEIVGNTDVGRVRDHNEDFIAWDNETGLVVLADGMGGHNAGEVASKMAVDDIVRQMKQSMHLLTGETETLMEDIVCACMESICDANHKIFEAAALTPQYAGMGTTLVMAMFHEDNVTIAHVGDSRMYRLRDGILVQLTVDHSLFQEMVQGGYMSEDEASHSLNKNMITRALGINLDVEIDVQQHALQVGDTFLLCSDGLSDLMSTDDIQLILQQSGTDTKNMPELLVLKANENGGHDNISVIIVSIDPVFDKNGVCS